MNTLKKIFFVAYLKNKGIRRICFIIGLILSLWILIRIHILLPNYHKDMECGSLSYISSYFSTNALRIEIVEKCRYKHLERSMCGMLKSSQSFLSKEERSNLLRVCRKKDIDEDNWLGINKTPVIKHVLLGLIFATIALYIPFVVAIVVSIFAKLIWLLLLWIYAGFKESSKENSK